MTLEAPGVLFGPYGTVLKERGRLMGVEDLPDAFKVLEGGVYAQETRDVAAGYARHCDVATTNTFSLRAALRRGDSELFKEALRSHHALVVGAIRSRVGQNALYIALGPYGYEGLGCYDPDRAPADAAAAKDFHAEQLAVVRELPGVDLALFETVCTSREAIGIAMAAKQLKVPAAISFVVGPDGNLLSGESLAGSIREVDDATGSYPEFFSVNCSPIEGVREALSVVNGQRSRIGLVYPNASSKDPRLLDGTEGNISDSDAKERASILAAIAKENPQLSLVGGCCGFDHEGTEALSQGLKSGFDRHLHLHAHGH